MARKCPVPLYSMKVFRGLSKKAADSPYGEAVEVIANWAVVEERDGRAEEEALQLSRRKILENEMKGMPEEDGHVECRYGRSWRT